MNLTITFALERETKGALRYQEVDPADGRPIDLANGAKVGTLYIRKSALGSAQPKLISVSLAWEDQP